MRAFHLTASAAAAALLLLCGTADRNPDAKTSAAAQPAVKASAAAANPAPAAAVNLPQAQDTLIVVARLVEIPGQFPPNDLYNYLYLMKYRVLNVVRGSCKDKEILVAHYNPRIPRSQIKDRMSPFVAGNVMKFETGDKHRLELIAPLSKVIEERVEDVDDYADSDLERYYALKADVVP